MERVEWKLWEEEEEEEEEEDFAFVSCYLEGRKTQNLCGL